jgi:hypothetical protein
VQVDTTLEFPSSSSTPWCVQSRKSDVASVIFPNSGELFRRHCSSLAEGEHTIAFVSSFPFRFAVPVHVWMSSPLPLSVQETEPAAAWASSPAALPRDPAPPFASNRGEHLPERPIPSSLCSTPRPNGRSPVDFWPPESMSAGCLFWKLSFTVRIRKGSFAFWSLDLPAIYRLVFVSCTFCGKPPTEIPLSHIKPTKVLL